MQLGDGGNGKGKLNDMMSEHILGNYPDGYACEVPMEALTVAKGERHPTELMDLWHSRLALARESDEDTRWNEGRVKRLTGGDRVKARRMRQDYVEFPATHKLIVFGNAKPTLRGANQGAWKRRLHMIPFPQKWDETPDHSRNILKADKDLMDKLEPEAPGILQKLIDALHDYQRRGFDPPRTVRDASEKYLVDQDVLAQWMTECCYISNPNETDTVNNLWANWLAWAERHKEFIGKRTAFMDGLERAGVQISRTSGQRGICSGIRLRESANI
jgi:putative DNA primase/helicase